MMPEAESETKNRPVASSAHKTSEVDSEEEDAQSFWRDVTKAYFDLTKAYFDLIKAD